MGFKMKRIFLLVLILGFGTPDALAANTYERVAEVIQLSVEFGSLQGNPDGTMSENTYRVGSKLLRDAYQKASSMTTSGYRLLTSLLMTR